jgi:hypothetical protein
LPEPNPDTAFTVEANGVARGGTRQGLWIHVNANDYRFHWQDGFVDSLTLMPDRNRMEGENAQRERLFVFRMAAAAPTPAANSKPETGLMLDARWDTLSALASRGALGQRQELRALLQKFAKAERDLAPHPALRIYGGVTYLLPLAQAQAQLGLSGQIQSGGTPSAAGLPAGLRLVSCTAKAGRDFEVRFLIDQAGNVCVVEFIAQRPESLPPPPVPLPADPPRIQLQQGKIYDFLPQGITAVSRTFPQASFDLGDAILIQTRGGPKAADLYVPKPFARVILFCLDLAGNK